MTEQAGDGFVKYLKGAGYIYLASPYTHPEPYIMEIRYVYTAKVLADKLRRKEWTYSPIVHCHELAKTYGLPKDSEFWREYDFAMLAGASCLHVLRLEGYEDSVGIKAEVAEAQRLGLEVHLI